MSEHRISKAEAANRNMSAAFEILQRNDLDTYFDIYVDFTARLPCFFIYLQLLELARDNFKPEKKNI